MADLEDALPRGIALAWGVAENPQRGPRRELSIERIVDAAIEIADAEGLAAVSMAKVAASLGFTTMSLYRYVTSKDDLLVLMSDAAALVSVPPEGGDHGWREGITRWAYAVRDAYAEHPWLSDVPITGAPMTPNQLLAADWLLRELRPLGLGPGERMSTLLLVTSYVRATSAIARDIAPSHTPEQMAAQAAALASFVTAERFPDLAPIVMGGDYIPTDEEVIALPDAGLGDDFRFGVERILDGIELYVSRAGERPRTPSRAADLSELEPSRDPAVREAAKARREAEKNLREALKRERDAVKQAAQRERARAEKEAAAGARTAEREARPAERAARR